IHHARIGRASTHVDRIPQQARLQTPSCRRSEATPAEHRAGEGYDWLVTNDRARRGPQADDRIFPKSALTAEAPSERLPGFEGARSRPARRGCPGGSVVLARTLPPLRCFPRMGNEEVAGVVWRQSAGSEKIALLYRQLSSVTDMVLQDPPNRAPNSVR